MLIISNKRGLPSQVKGAGLRRLSRRGSWVQIPPPAPVQSVSTPFGAKTERWSRPTPHHETIYHSWSEVYRRLYLVKSFDEKGRLLCFGK